MKCTKMDFCPHVDSKQWQSLNPGSRELLIDALSVMTLDKRPELQEKASLLKKTLEKLD